MMDLAQLPFFFAAFAALMITPGPDMAFILAHGIGLGKRAGVAAAFGFSTGALLHIALTALGVAAAVAAWPAAIEAVKIAGAGYLAWMGWQTLRSPGGFLALSNAPQRLARVVFVRAALTNIMNPKVILFFLVFLPQFTSPGYGPVGMQLLAWGLLLNVCALFVNIGFGLAAGQIGQFMQKSRAIQWAQRYGLGLVLLGLAARLFYEVAQKFV